MTGHPEQFPIVYKDVRRALVQHFPYALLFVVEMDRSLTVVACFHGSRNPARWQQHIDPPGPEKKSDEPSSRFQ